MRSNRLTTLPESFGELAQLKVLDLSKNQSALPHSVGQLAKLQALRLSSNSLSALPAGFGEMLVELQKLDLACHVGSSWRFRRSMRALALIACAVVAASLQIEWSAPTLIGGTSFLPGELRGPIGFGSFNAFDSAHFFGPARNTSWAFSSDLSLIHI